jgi:hypothetical protein
VIDDTYRCKLILWGLRCASVKLEAEVARFKKELPELGNKGDQ